MYRIDNGTAISPIPAPAAVGPNPNFFFTKGNPALSIPATIVDDDWLNAIQEEICNVVTGAGIGLSKTVRTQLLSAIQLLIAGTNSTYIADTGATNVMVVTPAPAFVAYVGGMRLLVVPNHTNTSTTPTINVNGLGAKTIVKADGSPLVPGDITISGLIEVVYQATLGKFVLVTSANSDFSTASSGYLRIGNKFILQFKAWSMTPNQTNNQPASAGTVWTSQLAQSWPIAFPVGLLAAWSFNSITTNGNYSFTVCDGGSTTTVGVYSTVWSDASVGMPQRGFTIGIGY